MHTPIKFTVTILAILIGLNINLVYADTIKEHIDDESCCCKVVLIDILRRWTEEKRKCTHLSLEECERKSSTNQGRIGVSYKWATKDLCRNTR